MATPGESRQPGERRQLWHFWIDRGGTFTDCIGRNPEGTLRFAKVLSSDEAPLIGIRQLLALDDSGYQEDTDRPLPPSEIKMGTTVATNALLERKGCRHALLITRGFADVLEIGTQQRPDLFDLRVTKPSVLYERVVEIDERVSAGGEELTPLDRERVRSQLLDLRREGFDNLAIVFLHGFAFPDHERQAAELARALGFAHISCSHQVCPEIGLTARGDTTTADAYLTPLLGAYLESLGRRLPGSRLMMMQSSGGLVEAERFRGHNAILSGPAGGVVACARLAGWAGEQRIIGFDMGGTSTDVSRFDGEFERTYETTTAGVRIKAPMLEIHTIAAGGGSICRLTAGRLTVGPDSAGADPGPICYGLKDPAGRPRAFELTVTDVNLYLGRILPENFPFALDRERVSNALEKVAERCRREGRPLTPGEVAEGFLEVINLKMAQAIKEISVARGHDARRYDLCCFGGAGGQHACAVARHLGIRRILIHPLAGVFSALGIGLADTTWEGSAPAPRRPLDERALEALESGFAGLEAEGRRHIESQGFAPGAIRIVPKLDLRYVGTETPLTISRPATGDYQAAFIEAHRRLYGYVREDRPVEVVQCRVEAIGQAAHEAPVIAGRGEPVPPAEAPEPERLEEVVLGGRARPAPVFQRSSLHPGQRISGPAIILESIGTIVVEPDFDARVDEIGHVVLEQRREIAEAPTQRPARLPGSAPDPIALEVFNHLFMSIAEQMGRVLQRTAISTNVKERLDFSCAIFDGEGRLVANAPHIPVHLGAMGDAVRAVMRAHPAMVPGDVFVTNNPHAGGSHLPDITTVTPVFIGTGTGSQARPDFFSASRAHHADVGGVTPGSITPFSTRLEEEGVVLDQERLVEAGRFNEALFDRLFASGQYPARNPRDNRADLQAQIAANHRGARLLRELTDRYGLETVRAYMGHVRANARRQVEDALGRLPDGEYRFEDRMDDGTPIAVRVEIGGGRAVIDFTGTGPDQAGNLNAPEAVARSATLFVVRTLVDEPIPLNEGCLEPLEIIIPRPSLLSPAPGRAVVAGNVETSTRVVDALLGALGLAAASQGTMNNLGFGDETFGYYETIAGGVGAAEGYDGAAAVHTHMTNTRITDPEILETRHPVRLVRFGVRRGSGGAGRRRGGDGAVRHFRFLAPLEATVLSERRAVAPFGLKGGGAGAKGRNVLIRKGGSQEELPGRAAIHVEPGDELIIETPGGGGWGEER